MTKRLSRTLALAVVGLMIAVVSCTDDPVDEGDVQGQLDELDRTVVALRDEVADLRSNQSDLPEPLPESPVDLTGVSAEIAALVAERDRVVSGLADLRRDVEVQEVKLNELVSIWDSRASELVDLEAAIEIQKARLSGLNSNWDAWYLEHVITHDLIASELESNANEVAKVARVTDEGLASLHRDLELLWEELTRLKGRESEIGELLAGIQVFSDELNELHAESESGRADFKILQDALESLSLELSELRTESGPGQAELEKLHDGLELLSVELKELWVNVDLLEKRVEDPSGAPEAHASESVFTLQLLHASDMDGSTGALQNVENFSAILNGFRGQYPNNTLVVSSGDNYIPGPRFDAARDDSTADVLGIPGAGRGDIALLNAMGFQASAIGNHELDRGTGSFASLVAAEVGDEIYVGALFPYLSSNLELSDDDNLRPLVVADGQDAGLIGGSLARSATITVGGERIGVVGATTPYLRRLTNTGGITVAPEVAGDFEGLAAEIQIAIDELLSRGIDKVILLSHMQEIEIEMELASMLRGVDIVVAGGSNTILADETDRLRAGDEAWAEYPLAMRSAIGEPVLVVNTDADYRYLGRLVVDFDEWGVVIPESIDEFVSGAYSTETQGGQAFPGRPVPEISEIVDSLTVVMRQRGGNVVGKTNVYLAGLRPDVRTQETNMGNLVTDSYLWLARLVDPEVAVGLKNSGGIRDHIGLAWQPPGTNDPRFVQYLPPASNELSGTEEGDISQLDVEGVLRFNNALVILPLTAKQLVDAMEHSIGYEGVGEVFAGRFPQVSGMRFSFDPSRPGGDRVRSLAIVNDQGDVIDRVVENGELIGDTQRVIKMVTINFIANGGDGYPFPSPLVGRVDLAGEAVQFNAPDSEFPDTNSNGVIDEPAGFDPGRVDFADIGTEQEALAEYLARYFGDIPFDEAETTPLHDQRVQNLRIPGKADKVFE